MDQMISSPTHVHRIGGLHRMRIHLGICSFLAATGLASVSMAASLIQIGTDPGCASTQTGGLSADGRHVAFSELCGDVASGNAENLGSLWRNVRSLDVSSKTTVRGTLHALSADGMTAVGEHRVPHPSPDADYPIREGIVLRAGSEPVAIGFVSQILLDWEPFSAAYGVSDDGSLAVGVSHDICGLSQPAVWTVSTGLRQLLTGFARHEYSRCESEWAVDVSGDGNHIVGRTESFGAYRWSRFSAPQIERLVDGALAMDEPEAISQDGSVVVGMVPTAEGKIPGTWSAETGISLLPPPRGGWRTGLGPVDVSGDGRTIVGGPVGFGPWWWDGEEDLPFVWDGDSGTRGLREVLEENGVSTADWPRLDSVWAISADGTTVAGSGLWHVGEYGGLGSFVASLPAPTRGIDLCVEGQDGCIPIDIEARSGGVGSLGNFQTGSFQAFTIAGTDRFGRVAFGASLAPGFMRNDEAAIEENRFDAIFGPNEKDRPRICAPSEDPFWRDSRSDVADVDVPMANDFQFEADGRLDLIGTGLLSWLRSGRSWERVGSEWALARCRGERVGVEILATTETSLVNLPGSSSRPPLPDPPVFHLRASGEAVFRARIFGTGEADPVGDSLVARGTDGKLSVLLAAGAAHDGLAKGAHLDGVRSQAMNESGQIVAVAGLIRPEGMNPDDSALFATNAQGEFVPVLQYGMPVPDGPKGETFGGIGVLSSGDEPDPPDISPAGEIVFRAFLETASNRSHFDRSSIWKWSPQGGLTRLLDEEDALPDLPAGSSVVQLGAPRINADGDVLIFARLAGLGPRAGGYWLRSRRGELMPLIRSDQPAPGLPDGVVLAAAHRELSDQRVVHSMASPNSAGSVLVEFELAGSGVDETNDRALYWVDRNGQATLVVRRGAQIETAHEEVKTISGFRVWYGHPGPGRTPINDRGDVVAILELEDGSEVVTRFAVPEPRPGLGIAAAVLAATIAGYGKRESVRETSPGSGSSSA